jgi:chorismate dehydratase
VPDAPLTVAAVSFLNSRPLIEGLEDEPGVALRTDVPSRLLNLLTAGDADVALCPVIDFQTAPAELCIVPVGAIGSDGATHTVRVFSRAPIAAIERIHTDGDSHTSVALLAVVLEALHGCRPELVTLGPGPSDPDAVLLIGDKVVHAENGADTTRYPYQLDLGEAWRELTGLPFVFAAWLARADADLGRLPGVLARCRERNRGRTREIVAAHANGWPVELATRYLERILRYEIGERELEAIGLFWARCHALGLIERLRPMRLYTEIVRTLER